MSFWQQFALPIIAEIVFFATAIVCVHRAQKSRIYPAFWQFLIFSCATQTIELIEGAVRRLHFVSGVHFYYAYFFTYWPAYIVGVFLILRVLHEMFRHAMRSVPGIQQMGRPIFFWALVVSVVVATASGITSHGNGMGLFLASAQILMRSQSVLALCMLAFLAISSHTLGVSFRSRIFGVTFGFGLMAVADLVSSALFANQTQLTNITSLVHEAVYVSAIGLWSVYFLYPEPARRMVAVPVTSPLMRWNDVAQTLGNPAGQVAVSYPPTFMRDVFDLVNNVMGPTGWPTEANAERPADPAVG